MNHAINCSAEFDLSHPHRVGAVIFQLHPAHWYSADTLLAADTIWRQRVKVSRDIPSLTLFLGFVRVTFSNRTGGALLPRYEHRYMTVYKGTGCVSETKTECVTMCDSVEKCQLSRAVPLYFLSFSFHPIIINNGPQPQLAQQQ